MIGRPPGAVLPLIDDGNMVSMEKWEGGGEGHKKREKEASSKRRDEKNGADHHFIVAMLSA